MSLHPTIAAALAEEHRRDLTASAEAYRLARTARSSRPAPASDTADQVGIIRQLVAAVRRTATDPPLRKVPAAGSTRLQPACNALPGLFRMTGPSHWKRRMR